MTTAKERRKKDKTKGEGYLVTYTRHLEKRLKDLKAKNLRLKQEFSNLQNEIDTF